MFCVCVRACCCCCCFLGGVPVVIAASFCVVGFVVVVVVLFVRVIMVFVCWCMFVCLGFVLLFKVRCGC